MPRSPAQTQSAGSSPKLAGSPRYRYEFVHYPQAQVSPKIVGDGGKFPYNQTASETQSGTKQSTLQFKMNDFHRRQSSQETPPSSPMYRSYATPVPYSQPSSQVISKSQNGVQIGATWNGLPQNSPVPFDSSRIQQRLAQYPNSNFGGFAASGPSAVPNSSKSNGSNSQAEFADSGPPSAVHDQPNATKTPEGFVFPSSPQRFLRDPGRQTSFTSRPMVPPRSLSLERSGVVMSPANHPRYPSTNPGLAQCSPKSPRSRLQLSFQNPSGRSSPGMTFSPIKTPHAGYASPLSQQTPNQTPNSGAPTVTPASLGRNTPGSLNLPFRNLSVMSHDTSSSPDSPGSFSLPGAGKNFEWSFVSLSTS